MKVFRSLLAITLVLVSAGECLLANSIVTDWNGVFLQAVRTTRLNPPRTARSGAILHTCIFDAWACYDARAQGTQYYEFLRRPEAERTDANKETAISFAAYRALVDQIPVEKAAFDAQMALLGLDPNDVSTDITTPTGLGNVVSTAVLAERHYDGANQLGELKAGAYSDYTNYIPVNSVDSIVDPDRWQPQRFVTNGVTTIPGFLLPHWGNVTPFALEFAAQLRPIPPASYATSRSRYLEQARAIIAITANLDDRKKVIVEYWADGPASETPPGHWNLLATQFVASRSGCGIDADAKLFFVLNNGMLDASIAVWEAKRFYDSVRPITAIRFIKAGKMIPTWESSGTVLGENWKPFQPDSFITPPFGEYPSGHSCFSMTAAYILRHFTGSNDFGGSATIAAGSSKVQPGTVPATDIVLSWPNFTDAAQQAGDSRRLGGIHFLQGDLASRALGKKIAAAVYQKSLNFIKGRVHPPGN